MGLQGARKQKKKLENCKAVRKKGGRLRMTGFQKCGP
jgi:hypothetical protein